jgi:hypothetical protein
MVVGTLRMLPLPNRPDDVLGVLQSVPLDLGHLSIGKKKTFEDDLSVGGLNRLGREKWQKCVELVTERFVSALLLDDVVLGGGNATKLTKLPQGCWMGEDANAFIGGFRLWEDT